MSGWVKFHRQMTEWQWYTDLPAFKVFIHLILKANFEDSFWRGIPVKRGQFVTGRFELASQTGLTEQQARTAINKLKSTNDITIKTHNKFSIITVTNYEEYQSKDDDINQQNNQQITNNQPTDNQQITTSKEEKETKEEEEKKEEGGLAPPPPIPGIRISEFCKRNLPPDAYEIFLADPEGVMPDCLLQIWTKRRGAETEAMWGQWTKFFKHFTSPDAKKPVKKDWETAWINWITK